MPLALDNELGLDPVSGRFKGKLLDTSNNPITINGLWALSFGNDGTAGAATALNFSAGPDGVNGLLGTITPVQNIGGNDKYNRPKSDASRSQMWYIEPVGSGDRRVSQARG